MTAESVFDDTASRKLEAAYLTPDVVEQRHATLRALDLRPGERVLDVGSGPGLLTADMAQTVGPSGYVAVLDVSDAMLALSQRRCGDLKGAWGWASSRPTPPPSRSPTRPSTRPPPSRSTSTSPTYRPRSPSCTGSYGPADGRSSLTPTGTRSSGTPPTPTECDDSWP